MSKIGIFIGRFQPFHNAHLNTVLLALKEVEHLIIVLGSASQAKTIKNPWTTSEREQMIRGALSKEQNDKVTILSVKDYLYNDNLWITALQSTISTITINNIPIDEYDAVLYGHQKDKSTVYLDMFPHWERREVGSLGYVSGTNCRDFFFENTELEELKTLVPDNVYKELINEISFGKEYNVLQKEYEHIANYKEKWDVAPYEPIFVTTDAVLVKSGHVLVVKRKGYPGKGLLALPGGFLKPSEKIFDGCLRELKEETRIQLPKDELKKRVVDDHVFDHPDRSLRGRTITHAFCFDLGSGSLPKVKGDDDDAEKAFWMPLRDVLCKEEEFFEDHFHIINFFVSRF